MATMATDPTVGEHWDDRDNGEKGEEREGRGDPDHGGSGDDAADEADVDGRGPRVGRSGRGGRAATAGRGAAAGRGSQATTDARAGTSVLLNGLKVLEAFSIDEPVLGVTEIARQVDLHKSSVSRILATLEKAGYVERDAQSGRFRLGLGLIALAGPLLADLDVRRVAGPSLEQLTRRTGETSALVVWNGHESVVVEQVTSPKQVKHTSAIGTRYDTYESSSVQVFLAEMPPGELQRLFERRLLVGIQDGRPLEDYLAELARDRRRGCAVNDGRTSVEEVGIAAPVRDHRGVVVAAVLLSAPRFRVPQSMLETLSLSVIDAAREVSARLGRTTAG